MPQTLSDAWKKDLGENWQHVYDTWLNTIANLTLTGYNSRYLNKRFIEKKEAENGGRKPSSGSAGIFSLNGLSISGRTR